MIEESRLRGISWKQNNGIYFRFQVALIYLFRLRIIAIAELCDAGNLIFAGFILSYFSFRLTDTMSRVMTSDMNLLQYGHLPAKEQEEI